MKKEIAFFDFDGTITKKDTMLELIRYCRGSLAFYAGLAFLSPSVVFMRLGFLSNKAAKERMLRFFFGGMNEEQFNKLCTDFTVKKLPDLIRPAALEMIRSLKEQQVEIIVVSASAQNWVKPWCDAQGLQLIATCLETKNGLLTGKITGNNCHGVEKVKRIKENFRLEQYQVIQCFGDTKGDRPMLALAHRAFYKPFR